jgi:hypothetical protein
MLWLIVSQFKNYQYLKLQNNFKERGNIIGDLKLSYKTEGKKVTLRTCLSREG